MTADRARTASSRAPIRDPLTGPALPEQHDSGRPHRSGRRANRCAAAAAECHRRQQLHPPAERRRRRRALSGARRPAAWQRQLVRPLHLQRPLPLRAGLVRRRRSTARRRRPGAATTSTRTRSVAGWTKVLGSALVNEARFSYARGTNDGTAGSVRRGRQRADRLQGRAQRSARRRRHRRHRHRRPHAPRLAELHAEVPAHQPVPVPEHARPGCTGGHQIKFGADMMVPMTQRVLRRRADARQSRASTASSPATRSPTSCSATRSARS